MWSSWNENRQVAYLVVTAVANWAPLTQRLYKLNKLQIPRPENAAVPDCKPMPSRKLWTCQITGRCGPTRDLPGEGRGNIRPGPRKLCLRKLRISEFRSCCAASLHRFDVSDVLRREVPRGAPAGHATVHDAIQERVASETVVPMDSAGRLPCAVEAADDPVVRCHALGVAIDFQATHAVMDHWRDNGHVEGIADLHGKVVEELLPPLVPRLPAAVSLVRAALRVVGLLVCQHVVLLECRVDVRKRDAVLVGELLHALVRLHDASALIVLAMPLDLFRGLAIQAQEEALAIHVQKQAAYAPKRLRGQELDLGIRLIWVDQASGVHLHPLEVYKVSTDRRGHFQAISRPC